MLLFFMQNKVVTRLAVPQSIKLNCHMNEKARRSKAELFFFLFHPRYLFSVRAAGSQAEMCQLRVGDEVLTVNRHQVAEMSYVDWKSCMEEALQDGSLVMDVRRHGQNSESSRWAGSWGFVGRSTSSWFAF